MREARTGEVIYSSTNSHESINLKRAQYSAFYNDTGLKLTKFFLMEKLNGQLNVIGKYAPHSTYSTNGDIVNPLFLLNDLWTEILKAKSISKVIENESIAAKAYWGILSTIPLQFHLKSLSGVPEHWNSFGTRRSFINPTTNRNASNPANAMLNYLNALLFAETRLGLLRAGFDLMAGIAHADNQYRDSFVYDVMEPVRQDVDAWLLGFVQNHQFSPKDFYEKRDGGIRLTLKITPILADTTPLWAEHIEFIVGQVKAILLNTGSMDKK